MPSRGLVPSIYIFMEHRVHTSRYTSRVQTLDLLVLAPAAAESYAAALPGPSFFLVDHRVLCVMCEVIHRIQRLL